MSTMAINLGRLGMHEEFSSIESSDPLIKWSCKAM